MGASLWILVPVVISNVVLVAAEVSGRRIRFSGRVINGEDANIADFPFYGALAPKRSMFIDREKTHLAISCGSSLIAPQFFITAYHCFLKHADPMYWVIIMGVRDRCHYDGTGRVVEVSWIYKHPQAKISNSVKMNDIALMLVSKPITDVAPLALPLEPPQMNEKGYIIGFGLAKITSPEGDIKDMACKPQKALQYVPDQSTCIKPKETIVGAFCIKDVNNRQAAACRGDSGGPYLVLRNGKRTLLGLSSFGDKLCKPSSNSDHFTDVHNYVEWINKMLHEPLPEGFKRMQENIQQFEPVISRVSPNEITYEPADQRYVNQMNGSNVLHMASAGRLSINDNMAMQGIPMRIERYGYTNPQMQMVANAPLMFRRFGLSFNTMDASGPGPAPLQEIPSNQLLSSSLVMSGQNPQPDRGNGQQIQYAQQVSGQHPGNWVMVNNAPAGPNMMENAVAVTWNGSPQAEQIPSNQRVLSGSPNNIVQYENILMPQRSFTEGRPQAPDYGNGPNNLLQAQEFHQAQSGSFLYPQAQITRHIPHAGNYLWYT